MWVDVVSLFPEVFSAVTGCGITGRAIERGLLTLGFWNPRDYTRDRHRSVDDRPYGGGPGMVMRVEPLRAALSAARASAGGAALVVHLTPQGRLLDQSAVARLAQFEHLVLLAGRYEGIDERVAERDVDEEWSIGDYVLSGGELPAMVLIDAIARLLPGALGDAESARQDSFAEGLLDCPHYTRPERIDGQSVPEILLSGNHAAVQRWRQQQALGRTWLRRPDLIARAGLSSEQRSLLEAFLRERRCDKD
jgi:tRNA (guanine37-N1)-methyltransferase